MNEENTRGREEKWRGGENLSDQSTFKNFVSVVLISLIIFLYKLSLPL